MHRILYLAALCSIAFLGNCKKDKKIEDLIVGKWNVTKMIVDKEDQIQSSPDYQSKALVEFTETGALIFTFTEIIKSDTGGSLEETYTIAGTYSIGNDDQLSIYINDGSGLDTGVGPVDINSNRLVYTVTNGPADFITLMEADKL